MRIKKLVLRGIAGLDLIEVDNLSDTVVLAGPNGVGKTRIITALLSYFRKPIVSDQIRLVVEATAEHEWKDWGKSELDTNYRWRCRTPKEQAAKKPEARQVRVYRP